MKIGLILLTLALSGCQSIDRGSFGLFDRSLNNKPHGYQVVDDPTGLAPTAKIERFEVRPGDCASDPGWSDCKNDRERSELSQQKPREMPGSSHWYGWSIYFPKDYVSVAPTKVALGQFHQTDAHVVWMFQETPGGYFLDDQVTGYTRRYHELVSAENLRGKWHRVEVNVRWTNKDDGFFRVWVNGEEKVNYVGPTMTKNDVYFKYGLYRTFVSRYEQSHKNPIPAQVVYFSNVRRASSRVGLQSPSYREDNKTGLE